MHASAGKRSLRIVLFLAVVYLAVGLAFGELASQSAASSTAVVWRRLAWLVSGAAFVAHIGYELIGLGNSSRTTAWHVGLASALGACGLAVAANIHELSAASYRRSMLIAIVAWPVLVFVPAFLVAFAAAFVLTQWGKRS